MITEASAPSIRASATLTLNADTLTPVAAALRLGDRLAFLLESVEEGARYGRYSFVGVRGRTLRVRGDEAEVIDRDGSVHRFRAADPLEALRALLPAAPMADGFPFPLDAGVGYLAFEAAARWERVPVPTEDPLGLPEAFLHLPDAVIAFDHLRQVARVASPEAAGAEARLTEVAGLLGRPVPAELPGRVPPRSAARPDDPRSREQYERGVAQLVEEIHAGEMLQTVLARRFNVPTARHPFAVYRSLRRINPSPYLFYVDLGEAALLGASPELQVRIRGGSVVTRPIAGTRPRSDDPVRDRAFEEELKADEKELAEHAMLVDLARNDVGRVAEPGSVEVPVLRSVERYSHVMHLVSEVRGRLRPGLDAFDAFRATFPAGTVSGAPKVRAIEAIAALEAERRGPYGGAVGFFSPTDLEAAITIRSVVMRPGEAVVHAGAGIVADSIPQREAAESAAKAGAVLAAIAEDDR